MAIKNDGETSKGRREPPDRRCKAMKQGDIYLYTDKLTGLKSQVKIMRESATAVNWWHVSTPFGTHLVSGENLSPEEGEHG